MKYKYDQEEIAVRANGFWEFRRLLNLVYSMGYRFQYRGQPSALSLYYWRGIDALFLMEGLRLKYIEKDFDIDCVDVEEFNNWLAGNI